jgi:probable addiction module antidote protein
MARKSRGKKISRPRRVKPRRRYSAFASSALKPSATKPWDIAEHLRTDADMAAYLDAALEDGDPALIAAALGDVARAKGMTEIAKTAGLGRTNLYKALSPDGRPEFATVLKIFRALGLKLKVAA